jgi:hypothetical protein
MIHWTEQDLPRDACSDAVEWCRTQPDLPTAWMVCERGDWMMWLAGRLLEHLPPEHPQRRRLTLAAVECAELVRHLWRAEDREVLRRTLDVARRWGEGDASVTLADVRAAAKSAYDANSAAWADAAAADAAWADAAAADAARAAAAAAWAARAAWAADVDAQRACADIVRRHWPTPPVRSTTHEVSGSDTRTPRPAGRGHQIHTHRGGHYAAHQHRLAG